MEDIDVPKIPVEHTEYQKIEIITEETFGAFLQIAKAKAVKLRPVDGLMYVPDQAVTRQFEEACRALVACLKIE